MSVSIRIRELVAAEARCDSGSSARTRGLTAKATCIQPNPSKYNGAFEQVERWSVAPIRQNGFGLTARPD